MIKLLRFFVVLLFVAVSTVHSQSLADFPIRGFAIGAPNHLNIDSFVVFINTELAPRKVNTLVLRVDFGYTYKSHPELVGKNPLTPDDVKKIVTACLNNQISVIPQINLLGHQSWQSKPGKLLEVYPEFDETPWVKFPEKYEWPNADSLYCKSYCPLHPGVHKVVFDLVDEICDQFNSTAFHAGMDEIFYIGTDRCPRCKGKNRAELFANELTMIKEHLGKKNRKLWIWGDRLLDGKQTGIGMWEASVNGTAPAIDLISKDIIICDWHYERADKTPVYLATKGFSVITCTWNRTNVATQQVKDMQEFRNSATEIMKERYLGIMQTVWSDAGRFMQEYYANTNVTPDQRSPANTFRETFPAEQR